MNNLSSIKEDTGKEMEFGNALTENPALSSLIQFYVFQDDQYIGWDCFDKTKITAGSGHGADLILPDVDIAELAAEFYVKNDRILVADTGNDGSVKVNGKSVTNSIIGALDVVSIGNYSIKIQLKPLNNNTSFQSGRYHQANNVKSYEDFLNENSQGFNNDVSDSSIPFDDVDLSESICTQEKTSTADEPIVNEDYARAEVINRNNSICSLQSALDKKLDNLFDGQGTPAEKNDLDTSGNRAYSDVEITTVPKNAESISDKKFQVDLKEQEHEIGDIIDEVFESFDHEKSENIDTSEETNYDHMLPGAGENQSINSESNISDIGIEADQEISHELGKSTDSDTIEPALELLSEDHELCVLQSDLEKDLDQLFGADEPFEDTDFQDNKPEILFDNISENKENIETRYHVEVNEQDQEIDDIINEVFDSLAPEEGFSGPRQEESISSAPERHTDKKPENINELIDFLEDNTEMTEEILTPDTDEQFGSFIGDSEFDFSKLSISDETDTFDNDLAGTVENNHVDENHMLSLQEDMDYDQEPEDISFTRLSETFHQSEEDSPAVNSLDFDGDYEYPDIQSDEEIELSLFNDIDQNKKETVISDLSESISEKETIELPIPAFDFSSVKTDEKDEDEEDDFPASFSLREKLIESSSGKLQEEKGETVVEVLRFHNDTVSEVKYVAENNSLTLIDTEKEWCELTFTNKNERIIHFNNALSGIINKTGDNKLRTKKVKIHSESSKRGTIYQAYLPEEAETLITDGHTDFLLRSARLENIPEQTQNNVEPLPLHKRILESTVFNYVSKAAVFHLIVLIVLSFTMKAPMQKELLKKDPHFVVLETKNIFKPVKPKKKPKPKIVKPKPVVAKKVQKKAPKKIIKKKKAKKMVASVPVPKKKRVVVQKKQKASGSKKGNVANRNVNTAGLLGSLGVLGNVSLKPNKALAAVTNIDAVTSTHAREARIKVGGIVGSLGDKGISIAAGQAFVSKGAASALRSAGIGGKGSVASLEAGNTGKRAVAGAVSAPLSKRAKFKGGGISRDAVAKVINEHIDEINYCYESALTSDPSLMGKVVFEWKILMNGRVGEVKIKSSSLRSDMIHSCIKSAIRSWKFPKPKGAAVVVSYPFVFDVSGF